METPPENSWVDAVLKTKFYSLSVQVDSLWVQGSNGTRREVPKTKEDGGKDSGIFGLLGMSVTFRPPGTGDVALGSPLEVRNK